MNIWITYGIIAVVLLIAELVYFKIADKCNIIDKPNERSSHSTIVLRGGGVIFTLSVVAWAVLMVVRGNSITAYLPFLGGLVLVAGISFVDDIHSLPDSLRMVVQIVSILLMFWPIGVYGLDLSWWLIALIVLIALFFCVGATNFINFMDGINGITAAYSIAMLVPLLIVDSLEFSVESQLKVGDFIDPSYLIVAIIGVLVFSIFNFRPKGKAKCFAGDVGSIGIAFIILFALGRLMFATQDVTYIVFFLIYGIDGSMTIFHRIILHENLGQAHRKHAYQLMANELGMSHVVVSLLYMGMQLAVSLGFIYLCPNTILAHWIYLVSAGAVMAVAYVVFMRKYYHLHEEYLESLRSN
ncbi:UDP-N-acetylmuramyl pentapeptide phosphotransferase/UDP-N-acetylglucosamine-1-phosphate transferase [Xylanibacter ruminicola]|uniref:UDP-N-acetylmuramyl pentapeptide phosphotransferase/UDP-N-acetylglucosamine-1-phosphate transferase n=1 Tax=Xylanibacter ruminicola TaxID=839 RepID=A0A1H4C5G7_XYLRU|nr:glycosyltransferase family 4 protein [Xylanibacter ruminicola]SEA55631.1 UDP-N-acetylmuramyl pentapeptide phosphotransferase/UDP-N-acetylglucosamine-1-phosphate transferase [Xylanibacter ruminicola]